MNFIFKIFKNFARIYKIIRKTSSYLKSNNKKSIITELQESVKLTGKRKEFLKQSNGYLYRTHIYNKVFGI